MFTGIIRDVGLIKIIDFKKNNNVKIKTDFKDLALGESISCSGVCLTVFKKEKNAFWVNVSPETQKKTNFKKLIIGSKINLEKSLKLGDELNGHLVFGHVDNISRVVKIKKSNDSYIVYFKTKNNISDFLVPKCSISVDGVSLTVNEVIKKQFSVNIIPYTWAHTSFSKLKVGDIVNTEVDMLARYAFKAIGVMKK